jgi:hypothetical protein
MGNSNSGQLQLVIRVNSGDGITRYLRDIYRVMKESSVHAVPGAIVLNVKQNNNTAECDQYDVIA